MCRNSFKLKYTLTKTKKNVNRKNEKINKTRKCSSNNRKQNNKQANSN